LSRSEAPARYSTPNPPNRASITTLIHCWSISLKSCEPARAATRSGNSQSGRRNAGFSGASLKKSASRSARRKERLRAAIEAARLADYPEDIAVAFAFFYCQNYGFGGNVLSAFGESLRHTSGEYEPKSFHSRVKHLDLFAESFRFTNITQRDFRDCLEKHDHEKTLFYCDPPYESPTSSDYKTGWSSDDTRDLVALLCDLDASAALSCYDGELYSPLLDAGYQKKSWSSREAFRETRRLTQGA
jgi:site-specific DNA-adenine methylase